MDAFEILMAQLLMRQGFWTLVRYKVNITKSVAEELGKRSMPRPEIDIVAYKPAEKKLYLLEVKSFLDSKGVIPNALNDLRNQKTGRYKLLTWEKYRLKVGELTRLDLLSQKLITEDTTVSFGLLAGNIYQSTELNLRSHFAQQGYSDWLMWGPETIKANLVNLATMGYENDITVIVSKIFNPDLRISGAKERQQKRRLG